MTIGENGSSGSRAEFQIHLPGAIKSLERLLESEEGDKIVDLTY